MMIKKKITTALLLVLTFIGSTSLLGQESRKDSLLLEARIHLNDYQDAAKFQNVATGNFDASWVNIFKNCFDTAVVKIIFDIPLKEYVHKNESRKQGIPQLSENYLEPVTIDQYIDTIKDLYQQNASFRLDYRLIETGYDMNADRLVFEIEKQFIESDWWFSGTKKYLFEIRFTTEGPKIVSIELKKDDFAKTEVDLIFIENLLESDGKISEQRIPGVLSKIKIDFDENINDRTFTDVSNDQGKIKLGLVPNSASIFIDTAYSLNGVNYSIPSEWKLQKNANNERQGGRRVNQQPMGGFKIPLIPYVWSGWSFTPLVYGGIIDQSANILNNFSSDSEFTNGLGYKIGGGILIAYFFNPHKYNNASNNWIFGVGSGFSVSYFQYEIVSDGFNQNPYDYIDQVEDSVKILVSGNAYEESVNTLALSVPVYIELKKRFRKKFLGMRAFSIQGGLNLMYPVSSTYDTEGKFSRHGLYPQYNNQVITDDAFYNYYTNEQKNFNGLVDYKPLIAEGLVRLNGFFDVFKNNSDNTLNLGLEFTFPFTSPTTKNPENYYISTGNDDYSSITYSRENIYKYYFGLTVGINLIKFKVD